MKSTLTLICFFFLFANGQAQLTWYNQTSGVTVPLTDICFIDNETGWISGWTGTMLHTINSGETWTLQDIPSTNAYYSVHFTDAMNGWASGYSGRVVHTSDGGQNWEIQATTSQDELFCVYFIDSDHGWIAGGDYGIFPSYTESRIILYTEDGGMNCVIQDDESYKGPLQSIVFVNDTTGYATGDDGILMRTSDGGMTWTEESLGENLILSSVFFIDSMQGWTMGNDFNNDPMLFYTSDGGDNWIQQAIPPGTSSLGKVFFADENSGWCVGNIGTIISTVDTTVGVNEEDTGLPFSPLFIKLEQNYPNPFSDRTRINFNLPGELRVNLSIYNILGQRIAILADETLPAGNYSYTWDGTSEDGCKPQSGIYIARLQAGDIFQSRRISLVR
jgi:photosystem II stability/assembly factor-like uncharacterized protein